MGGRVAEDGEVAVWVLAVDEASVGWSGDAQAQGADGDAAVGADFEVGAQAEDLGPPRALWGWAEHGAALLCGLLPGAGAESCAVGDGARARRGGGADRRGGSWRRRGR